MTAPDSTPYKERYPPAPPRMALRNPAGMDIRGQDWLPHWAPNASGSLGKRNDPRICWPSAGPSRAYRRLCCGRGGGHPECSEPDHSLGNKPGHDDFPQDGGGLQAARAPRKHRRLPLHPVEPPRQTELLCDLQPILPGECRGPPRRAGPGAAVLGGRSPARQCGQQGMDVLRRAIATRSITRPVPEHTLPQRLGAGPWSG